MNIPTGEGTVLSGGKGLAFAEDPGREGFLEEKRKAFDTYIGQLSIACIEANSGMESIKFSIRQK